MKYYVTDRSEKTHSFDSVTDAQVLARHNAEMQLGRMFTVYTTRDRKVVSFVREMGEPMQETWYTVALTRKEVTDHS
jgi:hypothetical protein